jgi:hypothetical protein
MSILPKDDKARKGLPLLKQIGYFPKALREITKVSVVNNVRYNPGRDPFDINWARGKSTDQMGSGFRHIFEHDFSGQVFDVVSEEVAKVTGIDRVYVLAEAAWRIQAALELEIEKVEAEEAGDAAEVRKLDGAEVGDDDREAKVETKEEIAARKNRWQLNDRGLLLCSAYGCPGHAADGGTCGNFYFMRVKV